MRNTACYIGVLLLGMGFSLSAAVFQCTNLPIQQTGMRNGEDIACLMPRGWEYSASGGIGDYFSFPQSGVYRFRVHVSHPFDRGTYPLTGILVDDYLVATAAITPDKSNYYQFEVEISSGVHQIAFTTIWHMTAQPDALQLRDMATGAVGRVDESARAVEQLRLNEFFSAVEITALSSGTDDVTAASKDAWIADSRRREAEALARSRQEMERYRMGNCTITVRDAQGNPVGNAPVSVVQTSQDFLFGANIFMFANYQDPEQSQRHRDLFANIFNLATTWLYWNSYEPKEGEPHYWETEHVYQWAEPLGIKVKGHPVLWDFPVNPQWVNGCIATPEQQEKRVRGLLTTFRGKVAMWDIVNEPGHGVHNLQLDGPYRWARECDEKAILVANDNAVLANGFEPFYQEVKHALARGVPIDAVGIQAHAPSRARFPLDQIQHYLDRYAQLGLKLHITELEMPSSNQPILHTAFEGNWTEEAQKDYLVDFYRICFAHPAVSVIGYWDFSDATAYMADGGLIRKDLTEKPAYEALQKLIREEFRTTAKGMTDAEGKFTFRGFGGDYQLFLTAEKQELVESFHLTEQKDNTVNIEVPQGIR